LNRRYLYSKNTAVLVQIQKDRSKSLCQKEIRGTLNESLKVSRLFWAEYMKLETKTSLLQSP